MRPTPEANTDTNDRVRLQRHWRQTDRHQRYERQASDPPETDIRQTSATETQETDIRSKH